MDRLYFADDSVPLDLVDPGKVTRKVKAHDERPMMVEVYFEPGSAGEPHCHRHEQLSYCLEGAFDFTIGDERYRVEAGGSVFIPGGITHGVLCLLKGRPLDMFSPPREDFLA
jgi:quercetin dioxygenase-like cupin family protein